mgnify:CR=1 FL=1
MKDSRIKTISFDKNTASVVQYALEARLETISNQLDIISVTRDRDLSPQERWFIPENIQLMSRNELREQIESWKSLKSLVESLIEELKY